MAPRLSDRPPGWRRCRASRLELPGGAALELPPGMRPFARGPEVGRGGGVVGRCCLLTVLVMVLVLVLVLVLLV